MTIEDICLELKKLKQIDWYQVTVDNSRVSNKDNRVFVRAYLGNRNKAVFSISTMGDNAYDKATQRLIQWKNENIRDVDDMTIEEVIEELERLGGFNSKHNTVGQYIVYIYCLYATGYGTKLVRDLKTKYPDWLRECLAYIREHGGQESV